ncbi:hypothetical protein HDU76_008978 [Blyttiomyces sp. JEL0837]|nr:hypothetical protein HDU76_008978 [Blyttiomyces sp. JEL0837]
MEVIRIQDQRRQLVFNGNHNLLNIQTLNIITTSSSKESEEMAFIRVHSLNHLINTCNNNQDPHQSKFSNNRDNSSPSIGSNYSDKDDTGEANPTSSTTSGPPDPLDTYIHEITRRVEMENMMGTVKEQTSSALTAASDLKMILGRDLEAAGGGAGGELGGLMDSVLVVVKELVESSMVLQSHWDGWTACKDIDLIRRKRMRIAMDEPSEIRAPARRRTAKKESYAGPGLCHGCHAKETPEWRRGPTGSRTLCNACGLIYMKMKKIAGQYRLKMKGGKHGIGKGKGKGKSTSVGAEKSTYIPATASAAALSMPSVAKEQ